MELAKLDSPQRKAVNSEGEGEREGRGRKEKRGEREKERDRERDGVGAAVHQRVRENRASVKFALL